MRQAKKYFALGFLTLAAACSRKEAIPNDTLIIGIESEVRNLDLRSTFDANSAHVISLYSQSLLRADDRLLPTTDLAESFQSKDNRIFSFQLPKDAHFHDDSVLDCADVLTSFQQAASPDSRIKSSFESVKNMRCLDSHHFEIELREPLSRFLLADVAAVRIQPAEIAMTKGIAEPIGSGPYKFVGRNYRDLNFERFDGYKRFEGGKLQPLPFYRKIIVRTLADPSIRWLSINSGDIDAVLNGLSPLRVLEARGSKRVQVYTSPGTTFQYLAINLKNPKFSDLRVRKALLAAIDRDAIIQHKLYGMAQKANSVLTPVNFFHHGKLAEVPYDPAQARRWLEESGQMGMPIEIKSSTDADSVAILLVILEQLRKAGFDARLKSYEFGTFFSDVTKGNYEIYSLRWTSVTDPDFLQRIFHSKEIPPGRNRVFYKNAEVDRLLERGGRESDVLERQKLYFQVQEIIAREVPYVPLWYPANVAVLGASINGFQPLPTGSWESLLRSWKGNSAR